MLFQQTILTLPFNQWIIHDKENKRLLWFSIAVLIISFTWIKILYPYPNFMPPDSYNYLEAAYSNEFISIWPIGYSKFLRLVSSFSNSHLVLVIVQYLLLQFSLLYFLFTMRYLLAPGKWMFRVLLAVSVLNPLLPHIANFVSSDCLFTTLSLVWFTQLMWIIYQPSKKLLLLHALVLLLAFMVRYHALFYPFISIGLILFNNTSTRTKYQGIGSIVALLLIFIGCTQYEYYKKAGTIQYTAFGGWQMAANALYGYAHAKPNPPSSLPPRFRELHTMVNQHMKPLSRMPDFLRPDYNNSVYYLWDFNSPLIKYRDKQWQHDSTVTYFKKWATMGPLYNAYGRYLIIHHPIPYIQYYITPNLIRYLTPPPAFMSYSNLDRDSVDMIAATWFGWKSNKSSVYFKNKEIRISGFFTMVMAIINIIYLLSFLAFIALGGLKIKSEHSKHILYLIVIVWCSNFVFSILTAPIELRYQLFPMIITLACMWLVVGFLIEESRNKPSAAKVHSPVQPIQS